MRAAGIRLLMWFAIAVLPLGVGCDQDASSTDDAGVPPPDLAPPPAVCKVPGAPPDPWFTEVTNEWFVGPNPGFLPIATTLRAGDLDGDGYADVIATTPSAERDAAGKRARWVYMNRPAPGDPSGKRRIFVDATAESNVLATRDGAGGYAWGLANIGDIDNDGDNDLIVTPVGTESPDPAACLLNDGRGKFTLGPASGLDAVLGISPASSVLFDYDRDGKLDYMPATFMYPPPNLLPPLLLRGAGDGTFADVTEKMGFNLSFGSFSDGTNLPSMYGITACDVDMDGDQDLLFADYGREPNFVYRNDGSKFTEIGRDINAAYDHRMDFSDDESYRCYCKNRPGKCNPAPPPPTDDRICTGFGGKDGRGWYPGESDMPWRLGGNTFSVTCGDLDDDGDMDLMTAEIRHGDTGSASDPSEILWNETAPGQPLGKFARPGNTATGIARNNPGILWNEGDMTPVFVDLDLDGRKDIYLCSSDYPGNRGWVWRQKADRTFEDVGQAARINQREAHGVAFADFDHDGDVDAVIGTSTFRGGAPTMALRAWRNDIGAASNWVQVQLEGLGAGHTNRSAIGALVKVTAGGRTQMQEVSGGYGHTTTQSDLVLTFGLGAACEIEKIEVRWLDAKNTVSTYKNVRANYRVHLREGSEAVGYTVF